MKNVLRVILICGVASSVLYGAEESFARAPDALVALKCFDDSDTYLVMCRSASHHVNR